jgi:hypothetical protein
MPDSDRPPTDDFDDEVESSRDAARDRARRLIERLVREGVKKAVEKGVEQITETPDNLRHFVQEMKLPREIASLLLSQAEDTKNGMYRAVAREIRDFLDHTNLAEEVVRALTTLSFEIKTEIRFIPNDQKAEGERAVRPDVRTNVRIRDDEKSPDDGKETKG